jgi:hypothetical protein
MNSIEIIFVIFGSCIAILLLIQIFDTATKQQKISFNQKSSFYQKLLENTIKPYD